ncbi:MAG TPA: translocation/assembly module TamB domain-containing protein [Thermoanaerobaculaceae bacterium]|nr:translocation/assembly module TamB domain-containing protein [Thermoanaerobaculaceae bacterium]HRS17473.1 translocation/assembly module TamB domain-containing protein [Thermoanaerobaculaceae bacterium]
MSEETVSGRQRRRWRRAVLAAVCALAALVAVAVAAAWLALGTRWGRQQILARAGAAAARSGIALSIRDFALSPRRGCITLHGVTVGAADAPPLAEAELVAACVELETLAKPVVHVRELRVERWRLHPDSPVPALGGTPEQPSGPPGRLVIDRIALLGGSVARTALPAAARWATAVSASGVDIEGSLCDDRLSVRARAGEVRVERAVAPAWSGSVEATLVAGLDGSLEVERLAVRGAGLDAQATLRGALGSPARFEGTLVAEMEPAVLVPDLASGGRLHIRGAGRFPEQQGSVSVTAEGLRLDDLAPLLPAGLLARVGAAGTTADVRLDLEVGAAGPLRPRGTASATWRRGEEILAAADFRLAAAVDTAGAATRLGFAVDLLPGLAGKRAVSGELYAASLGELGAGRLVSVAADVEAPDVVALHCSLAAAFPGLVPPLPEGLPVAGALDARLLLDGPLDEVRAELHGSWRPAAGGRVDVEAAGRPMPLEGRARVAARELPLALALPGASGTISGALEAEGSLRSYRAHLAISGTELALDPAYPRIDRLELEASTDGRTVDLETLDARLGERRLRARGHGEVTLPAETARLDLELERPASGIAQATAALALADGVLHVEAPFVETGAGPLAARVELPLGALARIAGLEGALAGAPVRAADGPIHLQAWAPHLDSCGVVEALGGPDRPERAHGGVALDLWADPADPAGLVAELQLFDLRLWTGSEAVTAEGPIRIGAAGHRLRIEPFALRAMGARFELGGEAGLAPGWRPGADAPASLVRGLELRASGRIPTALLGPYLAGGVARGELAVEARAAGTLQDLRAVARLTGPGVSLYWPTPYATRLSEPAADLFFANGELVIANGRLALNGGEVAFSGKRYADGFVSVQTSLAHLAYGLDFGVKARLGGNLDFAWDPASGGLLAGTVVVERAVLDRDLDLEREVLPRFLAPVQTTGTAASLLDTIDLDLRVETVEGLRVRNNVANLRAVWEPIEVEGTLWNPVIKGRVEIDPGGCVSAYNQRFRLDRAVATFTGDPVNDPRLDLGLTSSLENDTICREPGDPLAWGREAGTGTGAMEGLATGLAGYFGERLVGGVGEQLGLGRITIRPVYVFGETDPSARLTLTRDISRHAALAVSLDLRNTQRQTYILDLHGFRKLPRFVVQGFSNDEGKAGGSLQQVLEIGGSRAATAVGPELDRIVVEAPTKAVAKLVRKALRASPGRPLPDGALVDAEIEAGQALREAGYPEATVVAAARPAVKHPDRVELVVEIDAGRRVRVEFAGDRPPSVARGTIAAMYRLDEYEAASRAEMRDAAVRALRSLGFLDPRVEIRVAPGDPIVVTVEGIGGERAELTSVVFAGVGEDEAAALARRFAGPTERTELAAGLPDAHRRVEQTLRILGYQQGRVAGQRIDRERGTLFVEVESGPRDRVAAIEITGVPEVEAARLLAALPVRPGEPARLDRFAEAAALVERDLAAHGFAEARVRAVPVRAADGATALRLEVAAGEPRRVAGVRFVGQRSARVSWLGRVARIEVGEPLDPLRLAEARARLLSRGRFLAVTTTTEARHDGSEVTFRLREAPRFTVAYGVRWETDVGLSALVDVADRSLFGRGLEAAFRARWDPDDRSGRLLFKVPSIREGRFSLEAYAERRRRIDDGGFVTDSGTGALQLSRELGTGLTARVYARYSDVHVYEEQPDPFFPFDIRVRHPYLGLQLIRDTRQDPVLGVRGMLASLDLSSSGPWLGSDYRYFRAYGQLNLFRPVGELGRLALAWASSVRAGAARAFAGQELLTDVRFKTGGEYSVRGYPFESLGPRLDLGDTRLVTGGAAVLVVNQELRATLPWFGLTGLVFFDAGQVWAERADFGRDLAKSVGLGVRASTPVGVVRLDLARPLDRRPGDPSFKAYVGLGSTF